MAVEDELLEEMVRVFQRLRRMAEQFSGRSGLSRRQQRRVLREAMRDWLREDPQTNAVRQQLEAREFERRVAAEVDRILAERYGPENNPDDLDRNGRDDEVERREDATEDLDRANNRDGDRDGVDDAVADREAQRDEQDQQLNRDGEKGREEAARDADGPEVVPVAAAAGTAAVLEAEELNEQAQNNGAENEQREQAGEQEPVLRKTADGQQYTDAVIGADAAAEQGGTPLYDQILEEQRENQEGQTEQQQTLPAAEPLDGQPAMAPATGADRSAAAAAANRQEAPNQPGQQEGQGAPSQDPEVNRLRELVHAGQQPPGAEAPAEAPQVGLRGRATSLGQQATNDRQGAGRGHDTSNGREPNGQ